MGECSCDDRGNTVTRLYMYGVQSIYRKTPMQKRKNERKIVDSSYRENVRVV